MYGVTIRHLYLLIYAAFLYVLSTHSAAKELSELQVDDLCTEYSHSNFSLQKCLELAEGGNVRAQSHIGKYYEAVDYDKSKYWHELAIKNGSSWSKRQLLNLTSARAQGVKENVLMAGVSILMLMPFLFHYKKRKPQSSYLFTSLLLFPHYMSIAVFCALQSSGSWGALKHPVISGILGGSSILPLAIFTLILSVPIYIVSLKSKVIERKYVYSSMVVFCLCALVLFVFVIALSGLASQGAGK